MQYSYEFKARAVEKVLNRGPHVSFNSVAQSFGIDHSTLRRWVAKSQNHHLAEENMSREGIKPDQVTLHSDNGGAMRGEVLLVTLEKLGVIPSFSRSGVSSDNAYSESLFQTMK